MKLLVIGIDTSIANAESASAQRQRAYYEGWDVDIVILAKGSSRTVEISPSLRVHVSGGSNKTLALWNGYRLAKRLLNNERTDVISAQDPFWSGIVARWLASRFRVGLHLQDHSGFFAREPFGATERLLRPCARRIARRAKRIRTVSSRGKHGLRSIGIPEDRIDVIPIATDISRFAAIPSADAPSQHVLCIARLEKEKGVDVLIEAWRDVIQKFPDAKLRIVGDGSRRRVLETYVASLPFASSVEFRGARAAVASELEWASAYVQPSRFEGWGIAVVEAAAARRPVVMTDVGCAGELIVDGQSGIVVPAGSPGDLAKGIDRLLGDTSFAKKVAEEAGRRVSILPDQEATRRSIRASLEAASRLRLLVITQRVDAKDRYISNHVSWLRAISQETGSLRVIAQSVGEHDLSSSVVLHSLEKDRGASRIQQLARLISTYWSIRNDIDAVLILMVPLYVVLLSPFLLIKRMPVFLWYVHRQVTWPLRWAAMVCRRVFTAAQGTFPIAGRNVLAVGHAIDTDLFAPDPTVSRMPDHVIAVGRIAPIKRLDVLVDAVAELHRRGRRVSLSLIGGTMSAGDETFKRAIVAKLEQYDLGSQVTFVGPLSANDVRSEYQRASLHVNLCVSGSFDKVVLESMACGCPTLVANPLFRDVLPEQAIVPSLEPALIADRIEALLDHPFSAQDMRSVVVSHHRLEQTMHTIVTEIAKTV